jgi:hypothetical protein
MCGPVLGPIQRLVQIRRLPGKHRDDLVQVPVDHVESFNSPNLFR